MKIHLTLFALTAKCVPVCFFGTAKIRYFPNIAKEKSGKKRGSRLPRKDMVLFRRMPVETSE